MKKEIFILIGPASIGKSTYAKEQNANPEKTIIISRDEILNTISDKYGYTYDELFYFPHPETPIGTIVPGFEKYGKVIETPNLAKHICQVSYENINKINEEIHHTYYGTFEKSINEPNIECVFLDRVHMLKREREIYFKYILEKRDLYVVKAVIFNFKDADTIDIIQAIAKKRQNEVELSGRKKTIPIDIQKGMISRYEEVSSDEGFDEIIKIDTLPKLRKILYDKF